jgi:hypothetical protein
MPPKVNNVQQAIRELKAGNAPGPNAIPNRALRHLPKLAIMFLTKGFNAVRRKNAFPAAWKQARVVSILKPGKDPHCLLCIDP